MQEAVNRLGMAFANAISVRLHNTSSEDEQSEPEPALPDGFEVKRKDIDVDDVLKEIDDDTRRKRWRSVITTCCTNTISFQSV